MIQFPQYLLVLLQLLISSISHAKHYTPDWPSIDSRPIPEWYDESKIGIFIHWGVYSVPAFSSEVFWWSWISGECQSCNDFMKKNYKPGFTYQEFAPHFSAELWDPSEWAELFQKSGAKYVVLTSKHCEGFTLWPSKYSFGWNAMDVGPHRDLVGELSSALRSKTSLRFGLYYCLFEWFNPLWIRDKANEFTTEDYVTAKVMPNLYEIVERYKPDIIWPDGEWETTSTYWKSPQFLAWLYNESPIKDSVVTNDRWGSECRGKHGGFWTGGDRLNPGYRLPHKWENCMTLDKQSWGYRKNAKLEDYLTPEELITTLVETISCEGNLLVDVGPTREGVIVPIQQERLLQMGQWLGVNGEGIYSSVPWTSQNDTATRGVWYTASKCGSKIFAFITKWPGEFVQFWDVKFFSRVTMLGYEGNLRVEIAARGIYVFLPRQDLIGSKWVWSVVIEK